MKKIPNLNLFYLTSSLNYKALFFEMCRINLGVGGFLFTQFGVCDYELMFSYTPASAFYYNHFYRSDYIYRLLLNLLFLFLRMKECGSSSYLASPEMTLLTVES